jgi:hypothetical protein
VVKITFRNGLSLSPSRYDFTAEPLSGVDLIRIYTLPVHYVLLLKGSYYKYAWHMPSCKGVGTDVDVGASGGSIIEFCENGGIKRVQYPDGQEKSEITDDLMQQHIDDIGMVAFRTYTLLEFRDRKSQEVLYRIL